MRVDFEVRGSEAVDIYPIPGASPARPSSAPSTVGSHSPAQPSAVPPAAPRIKATPDRIHNQLSVRYGPIRTVVNNYGVIAAGIVLLIGSFLVFFHIFIPLMALVGIILGATIAGFGIHMLGKEEGWWGNNGKPVESVEATQTAPEDVSKSQVNVERSEVAGSNDIVAPDIMPTAPQTKNCSSCAREVRYAAVKCRYCGADISSEDTQVTAGEAPESHDTVDGSELSTRKDVEVVDTTRAAPGIKNCPNCSRQIRFEAIRCRYCGSCDL